MAYTEREKYEKVLFQGRAPGLAVEQIRRQGNFSMTRQHFHSSFEIFYLLEGERNYFIRNRVYRIGRGDLVAVGSGQIHKTTMGSPVHERLLLELSRELVDGFSREVGETDPLFSLQSRILKLTEAERARVEPLLLRIVEELAGKRRAYAQAVRAMVEELLIFILRREASSDSEFPAEQGAKHRKVNEVANYICANFAEISSLDGLSEQFYISKYYLCRIFKEVTGMTITQYINANRLKCAEKLLRESSDSVIRIAAASGFGNVTYFDRVFRESLGVSPSQYRKSAESGWANGEV